MCIQKNMKIAFNRRENNPTIGPYIFQERLIKYLEKRGVDIVHNAGRYHDLQFVNISGIDPEAKHWGSKTVLRIDGIYHDSTTNCRGQNVEISNTYHNVDAIVFQCEFSRKMLYKHFGKSHKAKYETVIHNGVGSSFSPQGEKIDYGFEHTLIMSGKWSWPSKRLSQMIRCFVSLNRKDLGLVVLGNVKNPVIHPQIKYIGFVSPAKLPIYYRSADIMVHMAYTDWCPNSVVEGLVSGLPVITTHNGGVPELIQGCGIVIKNEPDYNLEFLNHSKLPELNVDLMNESIDIILHKREDFIRPRPDLSIESCGEQYLNFFNKVLAG